jgi:outer membrane protein assembly factor BamB
MKKPQRNHKSLSIIALLLTTFAFFFLVGVLLHALDDQQNTTNNTDLVTDELETEMERGTPDTSFEVSVYDSERAQNGTTLFGLAHQQRVVEINMLGEVIWEYTLPDEWIGQNGIVGFDVERLENGNVLLCVSKKGIYEINREGEIVWSYKDTDNSHDADRLANENTLFTFGNWDENGDVHVKEVTEEGVVVWQWSASDVYSYANTSHLETQGWTHINAAQRLDNGNTMVNLRNFFKTVIVNQEGAVVKEYDWTTYGDNTDPHEPEINEDEHSLIVCLQNDSPYEVAEIDTRTEELLWTYNHPAFRTTRDCDRLENGNTLVVGVYNGGTVNAVNTEDDFSTILEITPEGEVVWKMQIANETVGNGPGWIYNAERY